MEQQIRQLIMKGKAEEALEIMTPYADEAILLRSRLSALQRNNRMGMIDFSEYTRELNRINASILSLLDSDDIDLPNNEQYKNVNKNNHGIPATPPSVSPKILNLKKPKVFVSYAHDDMAMLRDMQKMLQILKRNGTIDIWTDSEILPGQNWSQVIKDSLINADIVLLLLSASFLNSDYIWRNEMQIALKNSKERKSVAIPIILRPCLWREVDGLGELQALPMNDEGRLLPITKWEDKDEAWMKVAEGLKKVIENLKKD
jgi:TIR domain/Effector-associated domain 11